MSKALAFANTFLTTLQEASNIQAQNHRHKLTLALVIEVVSWLCDASLHTIVKVTLSKEHAMAAQ